MVYRYANILENQVLLKINVYCPFQSILSGLHNLNFKGSSLELLIWVAAHLQPCP